MNKKKVIVYGSGQRALESIAWITKSSKYTIVGYTFTPGQNDRIKKDNYIQINSLHHFDDCIILIASENWREIRRILTHTLAIPASKIEIYTRNTTKSKLLRVLVNLVSRLPPLLFASGTQFLKLICGALAMDRAYKIYSLQSTYSDRGGSLLSFFESGVALVSPTVVLETSTNIAYLSQPNANRPGFSLSHKNISFIKNSKMLINDVEISEEILSGILIASYSPDNFYHCVVEICSQLHFIRAEKELEDMLIYVPMAVLYIPHWHLILDKLNLMPRIKYLDTDKCYKFDKLYLSSSSNQVVINADLPMVNKDHYIDRIKWTDYRLWLRESFLQGRLPTQLERLNNKIYVARHSRVASNASQLEELLLNRGFHFLYPERHDVVEQAEIFSSASIIVGFSGAALTNLIFTNASVQCLIFLPEGIEDVDLWSPLVHDWDSLTIQTYKSSAKTSKALHFEKFYIDISRVELWLNSQNV